MQVLRDPTARVLTALVAGESVLLGVIDILLVVLALDVLGMSDAGPGLLNAMLGVGALLGAGATLLFAGRQRLARAVAAGAVVDGVGLGLAGLASGPVGASALIAASGAGKVVFDVATRTLVQRLLPPRLLTSVFGLQEAMVMGGLAVGSLLAPGLVLVAGTQGAFLLAGLVLPLLVAVVALPLRRVDRRAVVPREALELLRGVPFLAVLQPGLLDRLARESTTTEVLAGEPIVAEGEAGDRFHVIASGRVAVSMAGRQVRTLGPGGWFGELALLRDAPRSATVTALGAVTLCSVDRASFLGVVAGVGPAVDAVEDHARGTYR